MVYVTVTAPQKIEDQDFERSLDDCPQQDFRTSPSAAEIEHHLLAVLCYYFNSSDRN